MESFAVDRNLYEVNDVWDNDDFEAMSMEDSFSNGEPDWTLTLDHGSMVILHDRMITDALDSPRFGVISSTDHSYSLVANESEINLECPPRGGLEDFDKDLESECFPAIPMSVASSDGVFVKQEPISAPSSPQPERLPQSILKQPTIILATRQQKNTILPKVNIKVENAVSSGFSLPPTPPSSTNSDSEGCLSPEHLQQPSSPSSNIRQRPVTSSRSSSNSHSSLISSQPKGATGSLTLTEEEKRTLLAEGYPIPNRLPLSKAEEKSLKKIRRKIKNKISAQESRRKKKEYVDALEKKVEILNSENTDYKKRLDSLQNNNKSLLSQLQKLQALIGDAPSRISRNVSTQTAASLMMVVFCFAMCLGCWSVLTSSQVPVVAVDPLAPSLYMSPAHQFHDSYATPAKRSRLLLAFLDEWEPESKNFASPQTSVIELTTDPENQSSRQLTVNSSSVAINASLKPTNASK